VHKIKKITSDAIDCYRFKPQQSKFNENTGQQQAKNASKITINYNTVQNNTQPAQHTRYD